MNTMKVRKSVDIDKEAIKKLGVIASTQGMSLKCYLERIIQEKASLPIEVRQGDKILLNRQ